MRASTIFLLVFLFCGKPANCSIAVKNGTTESPEKLEIKDCSTPSPGLETIEQSERDIPVVGKADVVIAGGGVAGVLAALRAAQDGHSVILIETRNYLGQELTATYRCQVADGQPSSSTPLARKIYGELGKANIISSTGFDPGGLRSYLHKIVAGQTNIKVYFYSLASGAVCNHNQVNGIVFTDLNGRQVVLGKVVVDATEDARISAAAGALLTRSMMGKKTARRFISARWPGSLTVGAFPVGRGLGLLGNGIILHEGYVELALAGSISNNVGADFSEIHAATLDKSYQLRDYLMQEGIILGDFTPAPETWIDEMPAVDCRGRFSQKELASLDFSTSDAVLPTGLEGLVVAGRTVDTSSFFGSLQALLCTGELAGETAVKLASGRDDFPDLAMDTSEDIEKMNRSIQVRELLTGIEPDQEYQWVHQSTVELPVRGEFDVVVVGGGTSGAISAIAAARKGANVAIVEILPNLGGTSSNRVTGYYWGVPWKSFLRQELGERIHLRKSPSRVGPLEKVGFSGEEKKHALQDLALDAGVHIYYQSLAAGAIVKDRQVQGVVIENAAGRHVLLANVLIDATGQAGIAAAAGAGFDKGRETDGFTLEMEHGPLRDATHIGDISEYYLQYPSQAISLNIRESRRIVGDYMVTFDDAIHERLYPDLVCRWRANYDTHFPSSANQSDLAQDWTAILGLWRKPIMGGIPYRSLLPKDMDNILVAGKAYSTDHDALVGGRMQPDLEHLGEVAGIAAATAASMGVPPRDIPVQQLQEELIHRGVIRNQDVPGLTVQDSPSLEQLHSQDLWRAEREEQFPPSAERSRMPLEEAVLQLGTDQSLDAMVELYLAGDEAIPLLRPLIEPKSKRTDEELIPELKPLAGTENPQIREEAAVLLGLLGDRSAIPALMEFLEERDTRQFEYKLPLASSRPSVPLYWSSAILLGRFQEKKAVPAMLDLLSLSPPPEKLDTFRRSGYGDVMFESTLTCPPPLTSFLIVALGRIGDPAAADAIRPYLNVSDQVGIRDENTEFEISWGIRTNAAWALAQMGDLSGVPVLIELLDAEQAEVRNYAQRLLETITGEKLGRDPRAWEKWWQERPA
jgi:HEAT repeat protein/ribulose 1,5-bisphosphate synthetase/thiazole synthase